MIKDKQVKAVDCRFVDLPGLWQHFTVSVKEFSADAFEEGLGFDGSSIRGFQEIQESDMLLMPDPATAFLDPFTEAPTLGTALQRERPGHGRGLHARSAPHRH